MFKSFRVGSVLGIPLKLDITFLVILPVFAVVIGADIELLVGLIDPLTPGTIDPSGMTDGWMPWLLGSAAAVGLFACVVLHELGHSVAAMRYGYHIDSITLWLFGGLAQLTDLPQRWSHEFTIAIAGPVVSVACGVAALAPLLVLDGPSVVVFLLGYLGVMNLALAAFNMLPAFPMDGGRVLRALLTRKRSLPRATKLAAETGKGVAVLLGLWGLFVFNPIIIGIAAFIYIAANGEAKRVLMEEALSGLRVEEVMTPIERLRLVHPDVSVAELLDRMFRERQTTYPVVLDGRPQGIVTLSDAERVSEVEREAFEVRDIMSRELVTVTPGRLALDVFGRMRAGGLDRVLVIDEDGDFVGLLGRDDVSRALQLARFSDAWDVATYRPEAHRD